MSTTPPSSGDALGNVNDSLNNNIDSNIDHGSIDHGSIGNNHGDNINGSILDSGSVAENIFVGELPLDEPLASSVERYDLRVMRSLRQITRAVDIHSRQLSQKYDITAPQLVTLISIVNSYSTTIANIAKDVHLSPSTLVGIVDRLEKKGLVRRDRSTRDRRQVYITITPKGMEFADSAPSPLQETLSQALGGLSELEQSSIALSLERVVELMAEEGLGYGTATSSTATSSTATSSTATSSTATSSTATSSTATGNTATGNAATGNTATGNAATGNTATGNSIASNGNSVASNGNG